MKRIRVGVDPGKQGAIAVFADSKLEYVLPLPLIDNLKSQVDEQKLFKIFLEIRKMSSDIFIAIENVHAHQLAGGTSNFSFGDNCGLIRGMIIALELPFIKVLSKEWQKEAWKGVVEIRKPDAYKMDKKSGSKKIIRGKINTKATSLIAAKRLFPEQSFLDPNKTERSKKDHDGMVDAALIGFWCNKYL